jgi:hypothetical protein
VEFPSCIISEYPLSTCGASMGLLLTGRRLIDLVAEDNAIEDTIYHICRALDAERIDLDRFLKVRPRTRTESHSLVRVSS